MKWPAQLENGELLKAADAVGRNLPLVVARVEHLGYRAYSWTGDSSESGSGESGSYDLIEMPIPPKPETDRQGHDGRLPIRRPSEGRVADFIRPSGLLEAVCA